MSINKERLYNNCLDNVNRQIDKYQQKLDDINSKDEDSKFNPQFDAYGNKGEVLTTFEKYSGYLDNATTMKKNLGDLDIDHRSEVVRPGSIVETEDTYYFISVALGEIDMEDGSKVFAISPEAPVYKEMEGKKTGDTFEINGKSTEIKKIL